MDGTHHREFEKNPFVKETRGVQRRLLKLIAPQTPHDGQSPASPAAPPPSHTNNPAKRSKTTPTTGTRRPVLQVMEQQTRHSELQVDYLSAMIGPIDVGCIYKLNMIVTLNPTRPKTLVPSLKPVMRGQTDLDVDRALSDERVQREAVDRAKKLLRSGTLRLNATPRRNVPHPTLYGCRVKLGPRGGTIAGTISSSDDEGDEGDENDENDEGDEGDDADEVYWIEVASERWKQWDTVRRFTRRVNIVVMPSTCFFYGGPGAVLGEVAAKAQGVAEQCARFSEAVLRRVIYYLSHQRLTFSMNAVSRDGGTLSGIGNFAVCVTDAGAYKLMLGLSMIASNALVADAGRPFAFRVEDTLALAELRTLINQYIDGVVAAHPQNAPQLQTSSPHWPRMEDRLCRTLLGYQRATVKRMLADRATGRRAHFLNIKVGLGKTLILLTYLQQRGLADVRHIVYTMPKSAFGGVLREILEMGLDIDVVTAKSTVSQSERDWTTMGTRYARGQPTSGSPPRVRVVSSIDQCNEYRVVVVEHDTLRKVKEQLLQLMPRALFVLDEVHKCLYSGTQRTGAALELAKGATECVAFTGTPVLNAGSGKLLIPYMEMIVPFFVHPRNFIVAANAMVAYKVNTGVGRKETVIDPWTSAMHPGASVQTRQEALQQRGEHDQLLFGGDGRRGGDLVGAVSLCYKACSPVMVQETLARVERGEGVLLVANTKEHQQALTTMILGEIDRGRGQPPGATVAATVDVFCMSSSSDAFPSDTGPRARLTVREDIHLTNAAVQNHAERDYAVVIVRRDQCEGYTVTRLGAMVTSVYFSNQATREQMRGRIDRITQHRLERDGLYVEYVTVRCGILVSVEANYGKAAVLSKALAGKNLHHADVQKLIKMSKGGGGLSKRTGKGSSGSSSSGSSSVLGSSSTPSPLPQPSTHPTPPNAQSEASAAASRSAPQCRSGCMISCDIDDAR